MDDNIDALFCNLDSMRQEHCNGVVLKMKELLFWGLVPQGCGHYYLEMAKYHDIGYLIEAENHNKHGEAILRDLNLFPEYALYAIKNHGLLTEDVESTECLLSRNALQLLNYADKSVTKSGEQVRVDQRCLEIMSRFPKDSYQYREASAYSKSDIVSDIQSYINDIRISEGLQNLRNYDELVLVR